MGSSARAAYLDVSNVEVCSRRIVNGVPTQLADSYIPESIDARGAAEIAPQEERHHDHPTRPASPRSSTSSPPRPPTPTGDWLTSGPPTTARSTSARSHRGSFRTCATSPTR